MPYLTAMSLCLWALTERLARHQAGQELLWIMKMKFVEERRKQGNLLLKETLNTTNGDYEHRGETGVVERLGVIFRRTQDQSNVESYPVPFHPSSLLQWFSVPGCLSSPHDLLLKPHSTTQRADGHYRPWVLRRVSWVLSNHLHASVFQ